jgi:hypothetical protein
VQCAIAQVSYKLVDAILTEKNNIPCSVVLETIVLEDRDSINRNANANEVNAKRINKYNQKR